MRKALGRGLAALIPTGQSTAGTIAPISKIRPNHLQPRRFFNQEKLQELADSIREHGIAQPILVSYDDISDTYELIAGERRLRAAELAGLKEVEIIIKNPGSEKERLALAITENMQREDLNPIEAAISYRRLVDDFGLSQMEISRLLGKSKSAISNVLRLLDLPEEIKTALENDQITEGHARALLMIDNQQELLRAFQKIIADGASVRAAEALARDAKKRSSRSQSEKSADIRDIERDLQERLGTKIEIKANAEQNRGRISIHFFSLDDFDRILKIIKK
ncbi:MAG: ParB/RepB/Spo0J family partition protein [Elusimicrobiota bacterium]